MIEERCDHYVKQTYRNRCLIATADGVLALTVPVQGRSKSEGGDSKTPMREMRISEHGRWREMHLNALTELTTARHISSIMSMNSPKSIVRPSIAWSISTRLFSVWCCVCSTSNRNGAPTKGNICSPRRFPVTGIGAKRSAPRCVGLRPHVSPGTLLSGACRPQWFSAEPEYCGLVVQPRPRKSAHFA